MESQVLAPGAGRADRTRSRPSIRRRRSWSTDSKTRLGHQSGDPARGPRTGRTEIDRLLLAIPAAEYVRAIAGVSPNRAGKVHCPFHDDRTPSLQLYEDGTWYCFGPCRTGGSIFDFAARAWLTGQSRDGKLRGREFLRVRQRLAEIFLGERVGLSVTGRDVVNAAAWRSRGGRPGDDRVEAVDERGVAVGFVSPAPARCVLGELVGVGSLGGEDGEHRRFGAEVGTVLADVGVRADALRCGPQAVPAGEPGLDQGKLLPVPIGRVGRRAGRTGPRRSLASASARS